MSFSLVALDCSVVVAFRASRPTQLTLCRAAPRASRPRAPDPGDFHDARSRDRRVRDRVEQCRDHLRLRDETEPLGRIARRREKAQQRVYRCITGAGCATLT